jgi:1-acyl-sn-glycerol-3-phosphate acyltransferase
MVDKKLYNFKLGEWFFKKLGTVAVDTNTTDSAKNYNAIRTAVKLLKDGEKMVIFPEGRTHNMKVNYRFKDGATAISKLSKTVIVPFGIKGTYIPFTKLEIVIGKPIDFKELKINKEEENDYLENTVRNLEPFDHSKVKQIEDKKQLKKLFKKKCS